MSSKLHATKYIYLYVPSIARLPVLCGRALQPALQKQAIAE